MSLTPSMPLPTWQMPQRLGLALNPSSSMTYSLQGQSYEWRIGHAVAGVLACSLVVAGHRRVSSRADRTNFICSAAKKKTKGDAEKAEPSDELSKEDKLKQLGKIGGLASLGGPGGYESVQTFSAGPIDIDLALGGGWAKGRIVEVYGPESSGKTTLALSAIAEIQKEGGVAVFIDVENALDPDWAKKIGVDIDEMKFCQPESGEEAFNIVDEVLKSRAADLIVVDSVSHLTPQEEIDKPYEANSMGLQARMMSRAMRKISPLANKANCTVIFLNQIRMKIGVVYGNPETRSGGNALRFAASQIVEVRRKELVKGGKDSLGPTSLISRIKVVKNKIAPPFREAELMTDYNEGVLKQRSLIMAAEKYGIITRKGAFYYHGERKLGQGISKATDVVDSESELQTSLELLVREAATKQPDDHSEATTDVSGNESEGVDPEIQ